MSEPAPPPEVLFEFVRCVNQTVAEFEERLAPVLRGSLLMKHWFGDKARTAQDIDLECFERRATEPLPPEEPQYGDGFGSYGEFTSLVDFGKAMCRYAAQSTQYYRYRNQPAPDISFDACDSPDPDGHDLWTYGTPGERYYAQWSMNSGSRSGRLQIDIAQAGSYSLDEIGIADIHLVSQDGEASACPAYSQEMLLAAKLSWLLRGIARQTENSNPLPLKWEGELKDLFDAHLLLTEGHISPNVFQKCLLAVGNEDDLDWNQLDVLFDVLRAPMTTNDFPLWNDFRLANAKVAAVEPAQMLSVAAEKLEPLLGDFYKRDELPFVLDIRGDPVDESAYAIYADWLEERGSPHSTFLRLFRSYCFHQDELPREEAESTRRELLESFDVTSQPWLQSLFGRSSRLREVVNSIRE